MAEFNLNEIYKNTFGSKLPDKFKVEKGTDSGNTAANPFSVPKAPVRKEFSDLGQPYYDDDLFGREFFLPVYLDGYMLPFAVVDITESKTIVSTPLPERGGSVNELVSLDDYVINIKGLIVEEDNIYPEQQIKIIHDIFLQNASLQLRSALTDIFLSGANDHRVLIQQIKWPAMAGVEHVKAFEIDCKSDMIFTLEQD